MAESGLSQYLAETARTPFQWGSADCATFILGWFDSLSAATRAHLWGGYSDEAGCDAFIASFGGMENAARLFLNGWYGAAPAAAQPGNAVVCDFRGVKAMGIRVNGRQIALRTARGLLVTHRATPLAEWGIT